MQVLGGIYRKRRFECASSEELKPTARRVREALFETIGYEIVGARFLDLCAGSGSVGIEALSRGAAHATFVDRSQRACGFVETNLRAFRAEPESFSILMNEAELILQEAANLGVTWDYIFFDPPYSIDYQPILSLITSSGVLSKDGVLMVEHKSSLAVEQTYGILERQYEITLGETSLSFFARRTTFASSAGSAS